MTVLGAGAAGYCAFHCERVVSQAQSVIASHFRQQREARAEGPPELRRLGRNVRFPIEPLCDSGPATFGREAPIASGVLSGTTYDDLLIGPALLVFVALPGLWILKLARAAAKNGRDGAEAAGDPIQGAVASARSAGHDVAGGGTA